MNRMKRKTKIGLIATMLAALAFAGGIVWRFWNDAALWIRLQGGTELIYEVDMSRTPSQRALFLEESRDVVRRRLTASGLRSIVVETQDSGRLTIRYPGEDSRTSEQIKRLLSVRGDLSFRLVAPEADATMLAAYEQGEQGYLAADREWVRRKIAEPTYSDQRPEPPRYLVRPWREGASSPIVPTEPTPKAREKLLLENGHVYNVALEKWDSSGFVDVRHARQVAAAFDKRTSELAVCFEFGPDRAQRFADLTGNNVGRSLAFVMNETVIKVDAIKERIADQVVISGFTESDQRDVLVFLRAERLPSGKVTLLSQRSLKPGD